MRRILLTSICSLLLAGCVTTPRVIETQLAGQTITEVHDFTGEVPGCAEPWAGCYVTATQTAYYRPFPKQHTIKHERAHALGMIHTPWQWNFWKTEKCAEVTKSGGGYDAGQTICIGTRGETMFDIPK